LLAAVAASALRALMPLFAHRFAHKKDNGDRLLIGSDHRNPRRFPTFTEGRHCVSMIKLLLPSGLAPSVAHHTLLGVPGAATIAQGGRTVRTADTAERTANTADTAAAALAATPGHSNRASTTKPSARNYRSRPCLARHPRLWNPRHPEPSLSPTCTLPATDPRVCGHCPCSAIS
jgi:hypothetical protein